jgi:hypothetical protein
MNRLGENEKNSVRIAAPRATVQTEDPCGLQPLSIFWLRKLNFAVIVEM